MELSEMKAIWKAYDDKLEKSLQLNMHCLEMIQTQKVKNKLKALLWQNIAGIILHVIVIQWLAGFLIKHFTEIKFAIAAIVLILFFALALVICVKQIILIKQIDYSEDILSIQKKLTLLQIQIVNYVRLTFLCIPTYLAYPIIAFKALGDFDISTVNQKWWIANLAFTILIIPICFWLYDQVSYKNIHKKWVKFIILNSAGTRVSKAMEFMKEIDELKGVNGEL